VRLGQIAEPVPQDLDTKLALGADRKVREGEAIGLRCRKRLIRLPVYEPMVPRGDDRVAGSGQTNRNARLGPRIKLRLAPVLDTVKRVGLVRVIARGRNVRAPWNEYDSVGWEAVENGPRIVVGEGYEELVDVERKNPVRFIPCDRGPHQLGRAMGLKTADPVVFADVEGEALG
jgi:hypothetical protein